MFLHTLNNLTDSARKYIGTKQVKEETFLLRKVPEAVSLYNRSVFKSKGQEVSICIDRSVYYCGENIIMNTWVL